MADRLAELRAEMEAEEARRAVIQENGTSAPPAPVAAPSGVAPPKKKGGFDAGEIEPLKFNLKPYVDAEGVIPEPTTKRRNDFVKRVVLLSKAESEAGEASFAEDEVPDLSAIDAADLERLLDASEATESELRDAVAKLCNGIPTKAQITALPARVFVGFFGWLLGELSPEG